VDQNAPRLELTATPWVDAANAHRVSLSVTVTNVGHRPALAAIRSWMIGFRVEVPDGVVGCAPATHGRTLPREAFQTLKPGGATTLTVLVVESCGDNLFPRPGLYRVTPRLVLPEGGGGDGLAAITGSVRAAQPSLVRIAEGPDPFHKRPPRAVRASRAIEAAAGGPP
jgi:hypothetical protein